MNIRRALGALCVLLAVTSFACAGTITSLEFTGPGGTVVDNSTASAIDVVKTYTQPLAIDMAVTVDGAGSYAVQETIVNSTGFAWSDFKWELLSVGAGEGLAFASPVITPAGGLGQPELLDGATFMIADDGTLPSGGSFTIDYSLDVSDGWFAANAVGGEATFTVRQVDNIGVVPAPGVGVGLLSLMGMFGVGRVFRRRDS